MNYQGYLHLTMPTSGWMKVEECIRLLASFTVTVFYVTSASAQSTSTVTNNAAPSATVSTNANGGTQINQQLNNVFDTSYGFGPGIICKTPQILINGGAGQSNSGLDVYPAFTGNNQSTTNYTGSITLAIPIASSVIADCQKFAAQIAKDRVLSSELSLIRACAQLEKEKLVIDPVKYPNLAKCLPSTTPRNQALLANPPTPINMVSSPKNGLSTNSGPILQRFNP